MTGTTNLETIRWLAIALLCAHVQLLDPTWETLDLAYEIDARLGREPYQTAMNNAESYPEAARITHDMLRLTSEEFAAEYQE